MEKVVKIYLVGGAVRDEIMGLTPKDLDYVVVGSTPEEMLSKGFKQVGSKFPVFLHPETNDEYALARTEESTGEKYQDFDCYFGEDVTLIEDLSRRDLTINAMAKDIDTGELIDPFDGALDIFDRIIRHVSESFNDDPVRILRAFRFQATLSGVWMIDLHTMIKIEHMVSQGDLLNLTPERVWKEMEKALSGHKAGLFFTNLSELGLFPEIDDLWSTPQNKEHHPEGSVGIHTSMVINYASDNFSQSVAFAGLCHDFGKPISYKESGNALQHEIKGLDVIKAFCEKWKVPNNYRDLALMTCEYHTKIHGCLGRGTNKAMKPKSIMNLFTATNALDKKARFYHFLEACEADAKGRGGDYPNKPYPQKDYIWDCVMAVKRVDTKEISTLMLSKGKAGIEIGEAIRVARIDAIREIANGIN
jgi:tRNA nucleotidyltransferase (CCA-adding enzyme)